MIRAVPALPAAEGAARGGPGGPRAEADGRSAAPAPAEEAGVARWRQIAGVLSREIAGGVHAPGARLPTEVALAARFAVNRHTLRRAMEQLAQDGLVRVLRGSGAFVADDVLDYTVASRTRFSEWIRRHNREPTGEALFLGVVAASAVVAAAMGVATGEAVVLLERLGRADAVPIALSSHHFPPARLPGIEAALRGGAGISEAMDACGVADYRRQVTRVSARLPDTREASLLRLPRHRPVLTCENVNVAGDGTVVEVCLACYPTPRVQVVFEP